jgi:hypothetical protein
MKMFLRVVLVYCPSFWLVAFTTVAEAKQFGGQGGGGGAAMQRQQQSAIVKTPSLLRLVPDHTLPSIKKVILYNVGVGHVVHQGELDGAARIRIPFAVEDVDDVLKSLVFVDASGGFVRAIEYQSSPDREDIAAAEFDRPLTLAQLFQSFRGEKLVAELVTGPVEGTIVEVESRRVKDTTDEYVVLLTANGLQPVPLGQCTSFKFARPEMQARLQEGIVGLAKAREYQQESVELAFEGTGKRQIGFAYVIDAPVWRMTYRMTTEKDKFTLHGWAHVDNFSGLDWKDIELELRSGRPFTMRADLFDPVMIGRMDVGLSPFALRGGDGLRLLGESFDRGFEIEPAKRDFGGGGGGGFGGGFGGGGGIGDTEEAARRRSLQGPESEGAEEQALAFQPGAGRGKAGQLVNFKLAKPVTLAAGRSAALPVFSQEFKAQSICHYTLGQDSVHPTLAIQMVNSSEMPLVPGPVAIYQGNAFVGDSAIRRIEVGGSANIDFGIDQSTSVRVNQPKQRDILTHVAIRKGAFEAQRRIEQDFLFEIKNEDNEPRKVTLFVLNDPEQRFVGTQPTKVDGRKAEFLVDVPASNEVKLTITYASVKTLPPQAFSASLLTQWLGDPSELDPAAKAALQTLLDLDRSISQQEQLTQAALPNKKAQWQENQSRARENYQTIKEKEPAKAQEFLDRIINAQKQIDQLEQEIKAAEEDLAKLILERERQFENFPK